MDNKVIENRSGKFSLGDDGIIQIIAYPTAERTLADAQETLSVVAQLCQGQKYPLLADIRNFQNPTTREERQLYMRDDTINLILAVALVVGSPLSRIIASFFLGISKLPCPTQVFTSEEKAIQWLQSYCDKT